MLSLLLTILKTANTSLNSHHHLVFENLALRQQLAMLKQTVNRPRVSIADRLFWALFSKIVSGWRSMLHVMHPDTVVRWHCQGFRLYWRRKSRRHPGTKRHQLLHCAIILKSKYKRVEKEKTESKN